MVRARIAKIVAGPHAPSSDLGRPRGAEQHARRRRGARPGRRLCAQCSRWLRPSPHRISRELGSAATHVPRQRHARCRVGRRRTPGACSTPCASARRAKCRRPSSSRSSPSVSSGLSKSMAVLHRRWRPRLRQPLRSLATRAGTRPGRGAHGSAGGGARDRPGQHPALRRCARLPERGRHSQAPQRELPGGPQARLHRGLARASASSGLAGAVVRLAARGETGVEIDLDALPRGAERFSPFQALCAPAEAVLLVVRKGREDAVLEVFQRHEVPARVIGRVTNTGRVVCKASPRRTRARLPATPSKSWWPTFQCPCWCRTRPPTSAPSRPLSSIPTRRPSRSSATKTPRASWSACSARSTWAAANG